MYYSWTRSFIWKVTKFLIVGYVANIVFSVVCCFELVLRVGEKKQFYYDILTDLPGNSYVIQLTVKQTLNNKEYLRFQQFRYCKAAKIYIAISSSIATKNDCCKASVREPSPVATMNLLHQFTLILRIKLLLNSSTSNTRTFRIIKF